MPNHNKRLEDERRNLVQEILEDVDCSLEELRKEHKAMRDWMVGTKAIIGVFKFMLPIIVVSGVKIIFDVINFFLHR